MMTQRPLATGSEEKLNDRCPNPKSLLIDRPPPPVSFARW